MNQEKSKKREIMASAAALAAMLYALTCQFSWAAKKEIKNRVRDEYGRLCSEKSGTSGIPLEASHKNHQRCSSYNSPENGEYLTIYEHLEYHQSWSEENNLGLSHDDNQRAIESLKDRIAIWEMCGKNLGAYYQILNQR